MMEHTTQQKGNAVGMLLTGIAVGAVLGASAVVLSDEKKRKKLMEKVEKARGKAADMMEKAKGKSEEMKSRASEGMKEAKNMSAENLHEGEKTARRH